MSKWLCVINDEGIQAKFLAGTNIAAAAKDTKDMMRHAKIMYIFETGLNPNSREYEDQKKYSAYITKKEKEITEKHGAWSQSEYFGYDLRKRYIGSDYIEVLADIDAKDIDEFQKKYSGIKGAIEILQNTEKLMSPRAENSEKASKLISKQIRKLQIELEGA
jgi:hypothetical protein